VAAESAAALVVALVEQVVQVEQLGHPAVSCHTHYRIAGARRFGVSLDAHFVADHWRIA
jgi:hypothetical protein